MTLEPSPKRSAVVRLAAELAGTAVERDRQGGTAQPEKALIRNSGLLTLSVPREHGGVGSEWPEIYSFTRYLAAVDSSLAHLFAFHHLQVATIQLFGDQEQQARWLRRTVEQRLFWGNATNGRDTGLQLQLTEQGYRLHGSKSFCSGALGADALIVSAPRSAQPADRVFAVLPTSSVGLQINNDWDGFGQRQTDSGTVHFEDVAVDEADLLEKGIGTVRGTLRTCVSQLVLVQIYLGNALGALNGALDYLEQQGRAHPDAQESVDQAFIELRLGDLWTRYRAASELAERASRELQRIWSLPAPSASDRGELALIIAQARLIAGRVALDATSQIFDTLGARATSSRYGFDRFWRNVRVHTLHDPLDLKQRAVGRWLLTGELPTPSIYS
jgi:alkylation response protein AidB-like acyl-CoA dehydrogenase